VVHVDRDVDLGAEIAVLDPSWWQADMPSLKNSAVRGPLPPQEVAKQGHGDVLLGNPATSIRTMSWSGVSKTSVGGRHPEATGIAQVPKVSQMFWSAVSGLTLREYL